eukprot:gnl/TRDRNA2_/TRDRNA2_169972_c18_seq17.p1 gnl/TRDRNA2_/TRDRNA2_169972_c18~~gnl/TRDRNA2_/TRDRNA2_169972_c18_seq17.p1  ORF type:complete len:527 (-),score=94.11 gnl/TRDRNA2_/TRDRNA2_169972_c18_seq17:58-1581(-)
MLLNPGSASFVGGSGVVTSQRLAPFSHAASGVRPSQQTAHWTPSAASVGSSQHRQLQQQPPQQQKPLQQHANSSKVASSTAHSFPPTPLPVPRSSAQPSSSSKARAEAGEVSVRPAREMEPLPSALAGSVASFRETLDRAADALEGLRDDYTSEEKDCQALYREIRNQLCNEQERMNRIASTMENVLEELRAGANDLRTRNAAAHEELGCLRDEIAVGLQQEAEQGREVLKGAVSSVGTEETRRQRERQERDGHAAAVRSEAATHIGERMLVESAARARLVALATEVNSSLRSEIRQRVQQDDLHQETVEGLENNVAKITAHTEELRRALDKESVEAQMVQEEQQKDVERLRTRLMRVRRDFDSWLSHMSIKIGSPVSLADRPRDDSPFDRFSPRSHHGSMSVPMPPVVTSGSMSVPTPPAAPTGISFVTNAGVPYRGVSYTPGVSVAAAVSPRVGAPASSVMPPQERVRGGLPSVVFPQHMRQAVTPVRASVPTRVMPPSGGISLR